MAKHYAKTSGSSLALHVDEAYDGGCEFGGIRGQLCALAQGLNGAASLVVSRGVFRSDKAFGAIDNYEEQTPHAVVAPAGSVVFWTGTGVHGNCKPGHTLPTLACALPFDEALEPDAVRRVLREHGACVVPVLFPVECEALVLAATTAVLASRRDADNGFKGWGGSSLAKKFGISTHEDLRPFATHPRVLELWAAVLFNDWTRADELCYSPDAIAVVAPNGGRGQLVLERATLIMCYGDRSKQAPGEGARKLAHYRQGGTCNHPPTRHTNGGKGGHYSNGGAEEKRWAPQVPGWGKDAAVDARFVQLLGP
jgi:hypothetical protein